MVSIDVLHRQYLQMASPGNFGIATSGFTWIPMGGGAFDLLSQWFGLCPSEPQSLDLSTLCLLLVCECGQNFELGDHEDILRAV